MGQSTHRKFAITTGEVITIFLFGILIGAVCMSIAGCSGEFINADMAKDSSAPTMGLGHDSRIELHPVKIDGSLRIDGTVPQERPIDGGSSERDNTSSPVGARDASPISQDVNLDSSPETGQESEAGEDSDIYCQGCPPIAGRPGCCFELFKQCSSLNYLNVCVRPQ